jgi:hypothetical protein
VPEFATAMGCEVGKVGINLQCVVGATSLTKESDALLAQTTTIAINRLLGLVRKGEKRKQAVNTALPTPIPLQFLLSYG